jgi:hypothetical protein
MQQRAVLTLYRWRFIMGWLWGLLLFLPVAIGELIWNEINIVEIDGFIVWIIAQVMVAKHNKEFYCLSNQTAKDVIVAPIYNLGL